MNSALLNTWLRPAPDVPPDRQVLVGDRFEARERQGAWVWGRAEKDGYEGWLPEVALGPAMLPTHWIAVRTTWAYAAPDLKAMPMIDLHMTSEVQAVSVEGEWIEVSVGDSGLFVPAAHCRLLEDRLCDTVAAARAFLGAPYVWAGNTGFGLDCSGLVQAALRSCGYSCAADSGDQARMDGEAVAEDALAPGDLIFWKGHVAMVSDENAIIHANAHHMMVVEEPMDAAIARIAATDTGPVTSRLRVSALRL